MERGCHFLPFDQPFLISEKLLRASLERLLEMIEHPDYQAHLKRGVVKEFETLLSIAKSRIDLASPWLSREVIEHLLKVHREKGLKIRVLTAKDLNNEIQARSLEMLAYISRNNPGFQTRTIEGLHAKGMLVDDIILLHGSFNFTISGLSSNIENVALTFDIRHVQEFKEKFDKLWNNAEHLI
jgi:phosphatidylserine/phosphatidylglycerophosphate/cardiolipin synthase-like enzyme